MNIGEQSGLDKSWWTFTFPKDVFCDS